MHVLLVASLGVMADANMHGSALQLGFDGPKDPILHVTASHVCPAFVNEHTVPSLYDCASEQFSPPLPAGSMLLLYVHGSGEPH